MAISLSYQTNFHTLQDACKAEHLALMECTDAVTGEPVIVICAIYVDDAHDFNFVPLAKMFDGNPYEELNPPQENKHE